jgi:hypothetical protein
LRTVAVSSGETLLAIAAFIFLEGWGGLAPEKQRKQLQPSSPLRTRWFSSGDTVSNCSPHLLSGLRWFSSGETLLAIAAFIFPEGWGGLAQEKHC